MKFTLGVCAMETKVESSPMKSILKHLEDSGDFHIIIFPEKMILDEPITNWPVVECLIAFYSMKFPLEKAIEYVKLVRPIILNDLEKQRIMRSRINIYRELQACRIPHPNYLLVDHDLVKKGLHTFEEHYDYIVYNNVRLNKPFIEKPLDSDDHNNWIYYPSNAGGGCKKLFRKVHDRSSEYCPDIHSVRKNGTYIYEEFMLTYGTDIKVYSVGSMFAHAEARKSPTLDGKVNRYSDGKEYRYPVILTNEEKTIAYRIVDHFGQTVCGFDILRTFDGPYVCDVNGWSFVKRNKKYHIDCCQIIRAIFLLKLQAKYTMLVDILSQNKSQHHQHVGGEFGSRFVDRNSHSNMVDVGKVDDEFNDKLEDKVDIGLAEKLVEALNIKLANSIDSKLGNRIPTRLGDQDKSLKSKSHEELCSVIVVMRHADRKPKNKLKFFTKQKEILNYFKSNESEIKLKSSEELIRLSQINDQIIAELEGKVASFSNTVSSLDPTSSVVGDGGKRSVNMGVLGSGCGIGGLGMPGTNVSSGVSSDLGMSRAATSCVAAINRANSSASDLNDLLVELNYHKEFQRILKRGYEFSGINRKVQFKPVYMSKSMSTTGNTATIGASVSVSNDTSNQVRDTGNKSGSMDDKSNDNTANNSSNVNTTSSKEGSSKESGNRQIEKVLVIAKWGGDLTNVGKSQAEDLGRRLRQTLYPADSGALIRLHSTYRHDFKIFSSDEGRCQITGAAFTKGILDLEGELTPILVAMTIRNKKAYQLLNDTYIVEERAKCRYKLDELITNFGTSEYEEILQEMPEYDRYYYNKALEDADFSQEDLVNLSNLIIYYINTLNNEEMMWSSLYSVDDYAFHIVNKLSGTQNRWAQLLMKFHKPPCGGYSKVSSSTFTRADTVVLCKSKCGYSKVNTRVLDRIYGGNNKMAVHNLYGGNSMNKPSDATKATCGMGTNGSSADFISGSKLRPSTPTPTAKPDNCDQTSSTANCESNGKAMPHEPSSAKEYGRMPSGAKGYFRDDEGHSSDYCPEERYDYTKLSDIVDNIRYDLIHLHHLLGQALEIAFEIYRIVERLSSVISPCEYGVTPIEKLQIGAKIAWNLLKKIQHDVSHQRVRINPYTDQEQILTASNAYAANPCSIDSANDSETSSVHGVYSGSAKNSTFNPVITTLSCTNIGPSTQTNDVNGDTLKETISVAADKATSIGASDVIRNPDTVSINTNNSANENSCNEAHDQHNLNVTNSLDNLDYDIDFMVNNDTSAASIAANSLAGSGTYLDSEKIFQNGKCFIGGIRPTEMYLFNSSTKTEILWSTISTINSADGQVSSSNGSDNTVSSPSNGSGPGLGVATNSHTSSDNKERSIIKRTVSNNSDDGNDESLLLNSYSLWLHMSPSASGDHNHQSTDNDSVSSGTVSKEGMGTVTDASSTTVGGNAAINGNKSTIHVTAHGSSSYDSTPSKAETTKIKTIINDPIDNADPVNPMDPNQGWGWDEKIFDDLIRLGTNEDLGIRSQQRVVRSRYYVTSASHLFSVFNFFKYAHLLDDSFDTNLKHIENINDLHYLSHIVLRVWRSKGSEGFFNRLEILVSSGAKDGFGQNLSLLEQSAKNQKNKYKRHIQRYKLRTVQKSNCSHCPISLNPSGFNISSVPCNSASNSSVDILALIGVSNVSSSKENRGAMGIPGTTFGGGNSDLNAGICQGLNKTSIKLSDIYNSVHASGKTSSSSSSKCSSDIVNKYNLMVGDVNDKKFKCFNCFIEQYKGSDVQSVMTTSYDKLNRSAHRASTKLATSKNDPRSTDSLQPSNLDKLSNLLITSNPLAAINTPVSPIDTVCDTGSCASVIDTAGSCKSGVDNREDDTLSNKTVPPYCELNNLVVMNRNFGLDRLNNLIQKTYEQIISKG